MADELQKIGWDTTRANAESGGDGAVVREPVLNQGTLAEGDPDVVEQIIKIGNTYYHFPSEERLSKGNSSFSSSESIISGAQLIGVDTTNFVTLSGNNDLQSTLDEIDSLLLSGGAIIHSTLGGLGADDHSQYHNDTRGDARYYQQSEFINTSAGVGDAGKPIVLDASGQIDPSMVASSGGDNTSDTNVIFGIDENNSGTGFYFQWRNNGVTEIMRLTEDGYLGIGTTPTAPLHVSNAWNEVADFQSTDGLAYITVRDTTDSVYISTQSALASFGGTAGIADTNININLSNGFTGIGTSSPLQELHISGISPVIRISDSNSTNTTDATALVEYYHGNNGDRLGYVGYGSGGNEDLYILNSTTGGAVRFQTDGGNDRIYIDENGLVGINTVTPNSLLDITGSVSTSSGQLVTIDSNYIISGATTTGAMLALNTSGAGSIVTAGAGIAYSRIGTLDINEPKITNSGFGDTITNAFTLRVATAPTEGTNNYSLWVDDGLSKFEGNSDGVALFDMLDNTADNFSVVQGSNDYINISTVNGSETITYGEDTINPEHIFYGDMGINTASPNTNLHIVKSGSDVAAIPGSILILQNTNLSSDLSTLQIHSGNSGQSKLHLQSDASAYGEIYTDGGELHIGTSAGNVTFNTDSFDFVDTPSGLIRFFVDGDGNGRFYGRAHISGTGLGNTGLYIEEDTGNGYFSFERVATGKATYAFHTSDSGITEINMSLYNLGNKTDYTNNERFEFDFNDFDNEWTIGTKKDGTGVLRDFGFGSDGDNSLLYFDVSTNRIGIDNTAPTVQLDVSGDFNCSDVTCGSITSNAIDCSDLRSTGDVKIYENDPSIILSQNLGGLLFGGDGGLNGGLGYYACEIRAETTEFWSAGNQGAELWFRTTPTGTSSMVTQMVLDNAGFLSVQGGITLNVDNSGGSLVVNAGAGYIFYADASNDRVGIGIQSSGAKLEVNGDGEFLDGVKINESGNNNDTYIKGLTDDDLFYVDASTDRIGIGKNNPATKLDVDGTITATSILGVSQPDIAQEENTQTGTNYILADSDHGKLVTLDNASAITLTIPGGLRTDFQCIVMQLGAGQVTCTASASALLNADSFFKIEKQFCSVNVVHIGASNYVLDGRLVP